MSTLKQEILVQVEKGENVLQSSDAGSGTDNLNEGNVYECRFTAPAYDPASGAGVTVALNELRRYTREDANGVTQTYVIKKETGDQSLGFTGAGGTKIGLVGAELNIPQLITDLTTNQSFTGEDALLQNEGKYFTRKFVAEKSLGGSSVTLVDAAATAPVILEDSTSLTENWSAIRDRLFTGTPTATADTAAVGQLIYWVWNITKGKEEARSLQQKFFGAISSGDTVPAGSIFYYDGISAIFTEDDGSGGTQSAAKFDVKGFYIAYGADFVVDEHTDVSAGVAVAAPSIAIDNNGYNLAAGSPAGAPANYVFAFNSGNGMTRFYDSGGFTTLPQINFDRFSISLVDVPGAVAEVTSPIANTPYWEVAQAVTTPIDDQGDPVDAAVFSKTLADDLDERDFWNLISQGFVEDHDIPVGLTGLVGADDGGVFSPNEANGSTKAAYTGYAIQTSGSQTKRVVDVTSTSGSTGQNEVRVTVDFNHGLEVGDSVVIAGTGVTEVDGTHEVSAIGGTSGTDVKTFSLKEISKTVLSQANPAQGDITASNSVGTVTVENIRHIFWGEHTPPTTDQALLYRY